MASVMTSASNTFNAEFLVSNPGAYAPAPFIRRQAIFDENQQIFGYELFGNAPHSSMSDAVLLFSTLSSIGADSPVEHEKVVFVNCTRDSLDSDHLELIHPDRIVLEVPMPPQDTTPEDVQAYFATLSGLVERGFKLAFKHHILSEQHAQWLPLAQFIKMDLLLVPAAEVPALLNFARTHTTARLVVEKMETREQYEQMREHGVKLFQGFLLCRPKVVQAKVIGPAHATIMQLLELVRNGSTAVEIEELVKQDPVLSFNLLRIINSSGFGLTSEITSLRQAVMVLGYKKLFRWAVLLLTTSSKNSGVPPAVGYTAVVRARLMELLAGEVVPRLETDTAFLIGMFSLLDMMLDVSMEVALTSIAPPQHVLDALLRHCGPFFPLLELTLACEMRDDETLTRVCESLQLSSKHVNRVHLQALVWADSLLVGL